MIKLKTVNQLQLQAEEFVNENGIDTAKFNSIVTINFDRNIYQNHG